MTDFEIRYFDADGVLVFVHITAQAHAADAEELAKLFQGDHARFEIREIKPARG